MKHFYFPIRFIFIFSFLFLSSTTFSQYLETFSISEKGILLGPCPGGTSTSCANSDFVGVDWNINGNFTGLDATPGAEDYLKTISGVLEFGGDIDEELCYESPILDISGAGTVSIKVDAVWNGQDNADYADLEYQVDGGGWIQVPNQFGGGSHTIDYSTSGNSGSGTLTQGGLSGSTLSIRFCVDTNTAIELTTIDNVSVPEANVSLLPVELISFNAEEKEKKVLLKWATASETNNEKYEIEHSSTGDRFEKIGETAGFGTSIDLIQYSFTHKRPITGQNYYRLKQIDFDGKFEYSQITTINIKRKEDHINTFYPNPSKDGIVNLDFLSSQKLTLPVSIYDAIGRKILKLPVDIVKGANKLHFDFSKLEKGIYFVQLENNGKVEYQKLIIN